MNRKTNQLETLFEHGHKNEGNAVLSAVVKGIHRFLENPTFFSIGSLTAKAHENDENFVLTASLDLLVSTIKGTWVCEAKCLYIM